MYSFFIKAYSVAAKIASPFNAKAKDWVNGRKNIFDKLCQVVDNNGVIWMHCSSLGEYEQGVPLIKKLKAIYPDRKVLVTFFSPSGYNHRKNIDEVDYYFYLPSDTMSNAKCFIEIVKPVCAIFVKYEFWFNYIECIHEKKIPLFYVACNFRSDQYFFKWYGGWARKKLKKITHIFVQNEKSRQLLADIGIKDVTIAGDTRYDRVIALANSEFSDVIVENFKDGKKLFIAGSSWDKDEEIIKQVSEITEQYKLLIAPHVIERKNIERIKTLFDGAVIYTESDFETVRNAKVLIIDCIGKLSRLYRYADIAYIGGGFGKGIHNTLEAVAYTIPVIFGPKYKKFNEAISLVELGAGFSVNDACELTDVVNRLSEKNFYTATKNKTAKFVEANRGASDVISLKIKEISSSKKKLLTNS